MYTRVHLATYRTCITMYAMQYSSTMSQKPPKRNLDKSKNIGRKGAIGCRACHGEHWTTKCPYKVTVLAGGKVPHGKKPASGPQPEAMADLGKPQDKLKNIGKKGAIGCRACNGEHSTPKCPYKDTVLAEGKVPDDKKPASGPQPGAMTDPSKPQDEVINIGDMGVVRCRTCNGDHWTTKCPFKVTVLAGGKVPHGKKPASGPQPGAIADLSKPQGSEYVPPSMRDGAIHRASKREEFMQTQRRDKIAIRISNLSESTSKGDLEELVKPFGPLQKVYLAKDKQTNVCKGFAYVHFKFRADAAMAMEKLNGHGYDHLILCVEWSKPNPHNN